MGTTAQRFYPHFSDWDGTDPASGDIRKVDTSITSPADTTSQTVDFGTSGAKEITVDPVTTGRTTTGVDSKFGWAVNISGSQGMDGTSTAKRIIPAGTWFFQGAIGSLSTSLNACTVGFYVYRVAASPSTTRTLLFSSSVSAGIVTLATNFSHTTASQSQIVLEAGETIQVTYTLSCTGQVGGLVVNLQVGDSSTNNDTLFDVPSPGIRTQNIKANPAVAAVGVAPAVLRRTGKPLSALSVGLAAAVRMVRKPLPAATVGVASLSKRVAPNPLTATAAGGATVVRRTGKPLVATGTGLAIVVRQTGKPLLSTATGVASSARRVTGFRMFTATATGVASFARAFIGARYLPATAVGVARTWVNISTDALNRISGGGATVIRKVIFGLFD